MYSCICMYVYIYIYIPEVILLETFGTRPNGTRQLICVCVRERGGDAPCRRAPRGNSS